MRALELYSGIGGLAAALPPEHELVAAVEQSEVALAVYRANFPHLTVPRNISGMTADDFARFDADLWWMSPPCQSFTVRGAKKDADDPRAKSFLHLVEIIERMQPPNLALENVPGFQGSRVHTVFREMLTRAGYEVRERILCPTELGVPNRRPRYYLVASRTALAPEAPTQARSDVRPLAHYLDPIPADLQRVPDDVLRDYAWAMNIIDPRDPSAIASTFTSAYGRSWVRSGAYLYDAISGVRLFSPQEIARLLGFPSSFVLPRDIPLQKQYGLLGNSLSVVAVAEILRALPGLQSLVRAAPG